MPYSEEVYERVMGFPRTKSAAERTPQERHASWKEFQAMMENLSDEELADDLFVGRPLNTSILDDEGIPDTHTA